MNEILKRAKEELTAGDFTLVLYDGDKFIHSRKRGIAPLVELYLSGDDFSAFSAADKVVGRAAAFMYALLKVKSLYAKCISAPAIEVLKKSDIEFDFGEYTERISSRDGKGLCPMESAVMEIDSPIEAFCAITKKQKELFRK